MCNVRCVLVLATFPTKGFPTNVNAEGMQQLKAFGRTTQWCCLSFKGNPEIFLRSAPQDMSVFGFDIQVLSS
jgi:hypothetical protein